MATESGGGHGRRVMVSTPVGARSGDLGFNSFDPARWRSTRWIAAIHVEKGAGTLDNLSFTGVATRSGEPVTFRLKDMRGNADDPMPTLAFLTLAHDAFVTISRAGCDINY